MAQNGLSIQFHKKLDDSLFGYFSRLAQVATRLEANLQEESNLIHKAYFVGTEDYDNMTAEVDLAQLVSSPPFKYTPLERKESVATMDLRFGQKWTYTFNLKRADEIVDWLFRNKKIKVNNMQITKTPEEIKGKIFCKWYNALTHYTSKCLNFRKSYVGCNC